MNISHELSMCLKRNVIISKSAAAVFALGSIGYILRFAVLLSQQQLSSNATQIYAGNIVRIICAAAALYILSINSREIASTEKPFTFSVAKRFRLMAVLLIAAIPLAILMSFLVGSIDPNAVDIAFELSFADAMLLCFGMFTGIVSAIFDYGIKLEDELNLIA